jgi:hypothetical protein
MQTAANLIITLRIIQDTCSGSDINWAALSLAVQSINSTVNRDHGVLDGVTHGLLATLGKATELTTGKAQRIIWQAMMNSGIASDNQSLLVLVQERGTGSCWRNGHLCGCDIDPTFFCSSTQGGCP